MVDTHLKQLIWRVPLEWERCARNLLISEEGPEAVRRHVARELTRLPVVSGDVRFFESIALSGFRHAVDIKVRLVGSVVTITVSKPVDRMRKSVAASYMNEVRASLVDLRV